MNGNFSNYHKSEIVKCEIFGKCKYNDYYDLDMIWYDILYYDAFSIFFISFELNAQVSFCRFSKKK